MAIAMSGLPCGRHAACIGTSSLGRLAREERDAWVTWPARVAALMASELAATLGDAITVEAALMQKVLEAHVRAQLDSLSDIRSGLG